MLTAAIILWRMQRHSRRSFILIGQIPQSLNPSVPCCRTPWFRKRQLLHYTHFISHYVFSSSPESIVLSLPSCSQPFHLLHSHLCHTHSALSFCLIFSLYLSLSSLTLSLHWVIDLYGSHLALCWALFFKIPPFLLFPLLDLSYLFFASASGSLKNIKKSLSLSFLFLSLSGLCVVAFLSVYVSLCPTDHPVGPSARLY